MPPVFVHGAAVTRFGRRDEHLQSLAREAAHAALAEAGGPGVDLLVVAAQDPEEFTGQGNVATLLATALGVVPAAAVRVESASSSGASAVVAGANAVAAGAAETVLVVGVEKMTGVATARASGILARMLDPRERALGATMPAVAALGARAFMERFGATREDLAIPPVLAHRAGARNPDAHFQKTCTVEDVLASPVVADPLRVFDCAPVSDGAAAVVLSAKPGPVRVLASGQATTSSAVADRGAGALSEQGATRLAAARAFGRAGKRPDDVDVVELHDAFSVMYYTGLEALGFFEPGGSVAAVRRDDVRPTVNPGGGLKARGHPVGASGVAQVVELHRQLTRTAGARQADRARVGLAHSIGGFGANVVCTVLEAAE